MNLAAVLFVLATAAFLLPAAVIGAYDEETDFLFFGSFAGDSELPGREDAGALLNLKEDFQFFGKSFSRIVVSKLLHVMISIMSALACSCQNFQYFCYCYQ